MPSLETETLAEVEPENTRLREARHKLADRAGVTISDEPYALSKEDARAVSGKDFGMPLDVIAKKSKALRGFGEIVRRRLDNAVTMKLYQRQVPSGEAVELLRPFTSLDERFVQHKGLQSPAAELSRSWAVISAFNLLGEDGMSHKVMAEHLRDAKVGLYNSPENGAPTLETRTIELVNGTICEMNALAVGVPDQVIDTQVVVIPK